MLIFELDPFTKIVLDMVIIIFGVIAVCVITPWLMDFSQELQYLNAEIRRTQGAERRYWISQRRKLWLSILPFVKR